MKKGREEKTKFSKIVPNNQITTACRIELRVREMTMNEKLTMIDLIHLVYTRNFPTNTTYFLVHTRTCAYQGVRNGTK